MNTCPIYRRSGGYSYDATVPGPIGSILSPGADLKKYSSLPFASTLCGSCSDVCPVRINIHEQLYLWRQEITRGGETSWLERQLMRFTGMIMRYPRLYRMVSVLIRKMPYQIMMKLSKDWGRSRELPVSPPETFTQWFDKNRSRQ